MFEAGSSPQWTHHKGIVPQAHDAGLRVDVVIAGMLGGAPPMGDSHTKRLGRIGGGHVDSAGASVPCHLVGTARDTDGMERQLVMIGGSQDGLCVMRAQGGRWRVNVRRGRECVGGFGDGVPL